MIFPLYEEPWPMTLSCACPGCGCANQVEWSQVGQRATCRGCGKVMVIPAPMETIGPPVTTEPVVTFRCPACNRKFTARAALVGKKIRCSGCGAGVRVPQLDGSPPPEPSRPAPMTFGAVDGAVRPTPPSQARGASPAPTRDRTSAAALGMSPMLEDLASIDGIKPPRHAGTVLPSRSESMEQVRQQVAQETASAQEKAKKALKKKKKKRKSDGYFDARETLKLVAGVGALVAVLALTAWGYPNFRFPLGGLLCVIGFIVYLLGITSLRQHVAEEGVLKALMFRFFPPYQWWYVATRWDETKDFVAFFGAGLVILSIGGAIIKTSPVGKLAAAADRALEKADADALAKISPASPVLGPARAPIRGEKPSSPGGEADGADE